MFEQLRSISRRGFVKGASAAAGATVAISALASCSGNSGEQSAKEPVVVESGQAAYVVGSGDIQGAYEEATEDKGTTALTEAGSWSLPFGSVLRPSEGAWKPFVAPGEGANPMTVAGAFSVSSGTSATFVAASQAGGNFAVYDARCSDSVFAWCELDIVTRDWKLFAASLLSDGTMGTPSTLWEADADYDPPSFVCSGSSVVWLVMPATSGSRTTENSSCYLWQAGASSADEVVRSQGRFACAPAVSDGLVTLTPRVKTSESGRYYGITAYSLSDKLATVKAQLVLPQSVAPMNAVMMGDKFAFAIEANYGSGGLLGNMGTYIGNGDDPFVVLPREPAAEVAGKDGVYLIKTRASHLIVDTNAQTYATLSAPNRSLDYGDYPASVGTTSTFVTFATVKDEGTGYPSAVSVRAWSL